MNRSAQISPRVQKWMSLTERIFSHSEIAQVPKILWEGEYPEYAAQCIYGGFVCLIVPTNHRLLLIDHNLFDVKIDGFSYGRIDTVEYDKGVLFGWLNLLLPGRKVELKYIRRKSVKQLCEVITERCAKYAQNLNKPEPNVRTVAETIQSPPNSINLDHVLNQLERLVTLRQVGALTEQEFFHQKEIILGTQPHILDQQKRLAKANWLGVGRPFPTQDV